MRFKNVLPVILQSEISECGLACLAMIFSFHGFSISLSELRVIAETSFQGVTLAQLKKIAEDIGLVVNVLRIDIAQLKSIKLPCIAHWEINHFIVIQSIKKNKIIAHDPVRGRRQLSYCEVYQKMTGVVLELSPTDSFLKRKCQHQISLFNFRKIINQHGQMILKLFVCSVVIQCCYIASIKLLQMAIDHAMVSFKFSLYMLIFSAILGIKMLEMSAFGIRAYLVSHVGSRINENMASKFVSHLLSLPMKFFENRHIGDLLSRFGAIDKMREVLTDGAVEGLVDGIISSIALMMMCLYSIKIAFIIIIFSLVDITVRFTFKKTLNILNDEALHCHAIESSTMIETLRSILSIKIFNKESNRIGLWRNKLIAYLNARTKISFCQTLIYAIKNLLQGMEMALTFILGCQLVAEQKMSVGLLYAFLAYRLQFVTAMSGLVDQLLEFNLVKLHAEKLNEVLRIEPEFKSSTDAVEFTGKANENIVLKDIQFRYTPNDRLLLSDFNLTIHKNEILAITGSSGCGKTSLLKMLMGLLPPTNGNIFLGETPIYPDHAMCYRKYIASVMQNDFLLSGTIIDNISFFDPHVNFEKVYECAKFSGILDEINSFSLGFYTLIGDMGSLLSGGQRQRILLARALYSEPAILFLDEATSHLDLKKEREVNAALRQLKMTIIMVAHRQETIHMADNVVCLNTL